ncbi:MAG: hypothetical protein H0T42_10220 [Deltaproteobacteria bacterium]|nr:hypothetical protein [Deltaproteobacteria bacterium]
MKDRRLQRRSRGGRRRAVPGGLGMALGIVAVLMGLAFAAVQIRDCREAAQQPMGQR